MKVADGLRAIAMFPWTHLREPDVRHLLRDGQRRAAHAAAFADQALGALDPYSATSLPQPRRGLVRYSARGRAVLAMEGGCTEAGWHARVQAQRLAGVRPVDGHRVGSRR